MSSRRLRVLLLEPNADHRVDLRLLLEDLDHEVITATEAAEALEFVENGGLPDLIVTASQLPLRSGAEFLASLRVLPQYRWLPVFQLLQPADRPLAGVAGFLDLPLTKAKVLSMLNSADTGDDRVATRAWRGKGSVVTLNA